MQSSHSNSLFRLARSWAAALAAFILLGASLPTIAGGTIQNIYVTYTKAIPSFTNSTGTFSAIADSGLPLTITNITPEACSLSGSTYTLTGFGGLCTIGFAVAGNATWTTATNGADITFNGGSTLPTQSVQTSLPASFDALTTYTGGETLSGAYQPATLQPSNASIQIGFTSGSTGALVWPGGTIPIERFDFGPGGAAGTQAPGYPQNGWWWNPAEGGSGYAIETQGGVMYFAAYMYDASGNPLWYLASGSMTSPAVFQGTLTQYANGQTLTGAFVAPTVVNANVGAVTIQFSSSSAAQMTLPGNRVINIERFVF